MTEPDWGDLDQIPQKRPGSKLLFCGLGCLIPIALLVAAGIWLKGWVDDARDPDAQWENLRELVQYDQRPPGWKMELGFHAQWIGTGMFILFSPGDAGRMAVFLQVPGDGLEDLFDTSLEVVGLWTPPGSKEPLQYLEVQGRQLRVVLFDPEAEGEGNMPHGVNLDSDNPAVVIDLTPVGSEESVVLTITAPPDHQMLPSEIVRFLTPFHVGSDR